MMWRTREKIFKTQQTFKLYCKIVILCSEQVRIARIFNTYGPRMCIDDGRVVSNFVAQVIDLGFVVVFSVKHFGFLTKLFILW